MFLGKANEKRRSSNVNKVVWSSVTISTSFFLLVAVMGALAFPNLKDGEVRMTLFFSVFFLFN